MIEREKSSGNDEGDKKEEEKKETRRKDDRKKKDDKKEEQTFRELDDPSPQEDSKFLFKESRDETEEQAKKEADEAAKKKEEKANKKKEEAEKKKEEEKKKLLEDAEAKLNPNKYKDLLMKALKGQSSLHPNGMDLDLKSEIRVPRLSKDTEKYILFNFKMK